MRRILATLAPGRSWHRRWTLLLVGLVTAVLWQALTVAVKSPIAELTARVRRGPEPQRFDFAYRAQGTGVLDCVLPNRAFFGQVDPARGILVVSRDGRGVDPIMTMSDGHAVLHRSLFREADAGAEWIRLGSRPDATTKDAVRRALGADLAGYALGGGLPASGRATALAVLGAASAVAPLGLDTEGLGSTSGFRITVDATKFSMIPKGSAAGVETAQSAASAPLPVVDLWIDEENAVARVGVRPERNDHAEANIGWTLEYTSRSEPVAVKVAGAVTDIAEMSISALRPAIVSDCEVPL